MKLGDYMKPQDTPNGGSEQAAFCEEFAQLYPLLSQLLTLQKFEGKSRQTWTFRIYAEAGTFKAALTDRENQRSGHVAIESPLHAFETLERHLENGTLSLRQWDTRKFK